MKIEQLYKKGNNFFQSAAWLSFQEDYGKELKKFDNVFGIKTALPLGKSFIWIQKAPENLEKANFENMDFGGDVTFVRVEPTTITEGAVQKHALKKVQTGSLLSGQKSPVATQVLDLTQKEEEILAKMKPKTRYNIRLAEKKGVRVRVSENAEDVETFYGLLQMTSQRNKGEYVPHQKKYYEEMMKVLGQGHYLKFYFAEYEGEAIAGIMIAHYGDLAIYLHGGFGTKHKELMAPYLCHWQAIKEAKAAGLKFYDFWGVAESDDPRDPWAGITRFKKGFGGETIVFPGSFDLVLKPFWYNVFSIAAKLRKIVRP